MRPWNPFSIVPFGFYLCAGSGPLQRFLYPKPLAGQNKRVGPFQRFHWPANKRGESSCIHPSSRKEREREYWANNGRNSTVRWISFSSFVWIRRLSANWRSSQSISPMIKRVPVDRKYLGYYFQCHNRCYNVRLFVQSTWPLRKQKEKMSRLFFLSLFRCLRLLLLPRSMFTTNKKSRNKRTRVAPDAHTELMDHPAGVFSVQLFFFECVRSKTGRFPSHTTQVWPGLYSFSEGGFLHNMLSIWRQCWQAQDCLGVSFDLLRRRKELSSVI